MHAEHASDRLVFPVFPLARPGLLLRVEGLALFTAAALAYAHLRGNGWLFAALLLVPDVFMVGYLRGTALGAAVYNLGHVTAVPGLLLLAALIAGWQPGVWIALIWLAHIGMDRVAGYGLKYPTTFKDTHLNRL